MPDVLIKKPGAVVMDITGTLLSKSFMTYSQETRKFMLQNYREFVNECWNKTILRTSMNFLRKDVDTGASQAPQIADRKVAPQEQIQSLIDHLQYRFENEWHKRCASIGVFHLAISEWGYRKGLLKTPVYDDVSSTLTKWKMIDSIKLFISVGPSNFVKNVFSRTTQGNLLPLIDGHMNLMEGREKNFGKLVQLLNLEPTSIVFITRLPFDAKLASKEKINSVIIVRKDFAPKIYKMVMDGTTKNMVEFNSTDEPKLRKKKKKPKSELMSNKESKNDLGELPSEELTHNLEAVTSNFESDYDPSSVSRLSYKDLQELPIICSLDNLKWKE